MSFLETFVQSPWAGAIGWTLLHSLWQGAIVSAALLMVLLAARSPRIRYAAACLGLLGMLTALNFGTPENLKKGIEETRRRTKKPFGVNLTILPALVPPNYEAFAQMIIDMNVKIVETAGNDPKKWVSMFKQAGCICIHKCVTIRHALSAEKIGVDIISVDGFECAGHPGEAGWFFVVFAPHRNGPLLPWRRGKTRNKIKTTRANSNLPRFFCLAQMSVALSCLPRLPRS